MNTSKYDAQTRKDIKRSSRTRGYAAVKAMWGGEREQLLATIHEQAVQIKGLRAKLAAAEAK